MAQQNAPSCHACGIGNKCEQRNLLLERDNCAKEQMFEWANNERKGRKYNVKNNALDYAEIASCIGYIF